LEANQRQITDMIKKAEEPRKEWFFRLAEEGLIHHPKQGSIIEVLSGFSE
jgi:hypothetical protein